MKKKQFFTILIVVLLGVFTTKAQNSNGVKNTLNFEVGIGARGLLIIGYRYHFNK